MNNLEKAKKLKQEREEKAQKERAEKEAKLRRGQETVTKLRADIVQELACYHDQVCNRNGGGRFVWDPETLTMSVRHGKGSWNIFRVKVRWRTNVCVWDDPDTGSVYRDQPEITMSSHAASHGETKYEVLTPFLNDVAELMSKYI